MVPKMVQRWPRMVPRWPQDGPNMAQVDPGDPPRIPQDLKKSVKTNSFSIFSEG